jgi:phage-related minor tail protein
MAGTPYVVGEKGPELFVPSSHGNVVPNGSMPGGNVTMNISTPDANSFRKAQTQVMTEYQRGLSRAARRNG